MNILNNIERMDLNTFLILYAGIRIGFIINTISLLNTLDLINLIHCCFILYYNNSIYGCISLLSEFFLGIINIFIWNSLFINQKIYTIISVLPIILIWLIVGGFYTVYNLHRMYWLKKYNESNFKIKIKMKEKKLKIPELCSICYENVNNGYYICNNNHYYHYECLNQWIKFKGNQATCPYCREVTNK